MLSKLHHALSFIETERREIDEVMHRGSAQFDETVCGFRDDGAAIGVADEDDTSFELRCNVDNMLGIAVHVAQGKRRCAVPRQIDGNRCDTALVEFGLQRRPAPCSVPRTVNEQYQWRIVRSVTVLAFRSDGVFWHGRDRATKP